MIATHNEPDGLDDIRASFGDYEKPAVKYPKGTPEYDAYKAELTVELGKFARGEDPYPYEFDCVSPEPRCSGCDAPLAKHIGGQPCAVGEIRTARTVRDLPIARWAHAEQAAPRDVVVDGWNGCSQPVYCYRDELHLPRYARHGVDYRTVVGDNRYDHAIASARGVNAAAIPYGSQR